VGDRVGARMDHRLSRRERLALFLHRELDHRLTPLGVAVFRRATDRPFPVVRLVPVGPRDPGPAVSVPD
jgi:hypothetical protein